MLCVYNNLIQQVVKAPEPDNIIWENLEFSKRKRVVRQYVTGLVSFVLLMLSFALILSLNGVTTSFANIIPKIEYCQSEVRLGDCNPCSSEGII